jgi:hypothetical protein
MIWDNIAQRCRKMCRHMGIFKRVLERQQSSPGISNLATTTTTTTTMMTTTFLSGVRCSVGVGGERLVGKFQDKFGSRRKKLERKIRDAKITYLAPTKSDDYRKRKAKKAHRKQRRAVWGVQRGRRQPRAARPVGGLPLKQP